jgi:hypothetical protein
MEYISTLLEDVISFFKISKKILLNKEDKEEIINAVTNAVLLTEDFFYNNGNRKVERNKKVAEAWINAGRILQIKLPRENIGYWLQNKGEAYLNPELWSEKVLEENKLQIEEIKKQIQKINKSLIKFKI